MIIFICSLYLPDISGRFFYALIESWCFELNTEEKYMSRAIELAKQAIGHTNPNPIVGCVVVKDGRIISEGFHERIGEFHAERNALTRCKEDTEGADLYVTLEPCCHYGRTPPCTEIIIEKKIKRVFVGSLDCNPKVAGKGVQILREQGIEVKTGILEKECLEMNEVFYHYMTTGKPFVAVKYAMTLDGKIACSNGDSKWITNELSRRHVQELRKRYSAILVGINTVLLDDPMLNCRIEDGVDPIRVICDSQLRIPENSRIVNTADSIRTIIACVEDAFNNEQNREKIEYLNSRGIEIITAGREKNDISIVLDKLAQMNIDSVLIEGGSSIFGSVIDAKLADKFYIYVGSQIIGGKCAPSPVGGVGAGSMTETLKLKNISYEKFEDDILIVAYPDNE